MPKAQHVCRFPFGKPSAKNDITLGLTFRGSHRIKKGVVPARKVTSLFEVHLLKVTSLFHCTEEEGLDPDLYTEPALDWFRYHHAYEWHP